MTHPSPDRESFDDVVARYEGVLFDAYGVLVTHGGVLPGAREALARVRAAGKPLLVVTNDASRLPSTLGTWYRSLGLDVADHEIVSSGTALVRVLRRDHPGARVAVLGTGESRALLARSDVDVCPVDTPFDVLTVCDEAFAPMLETLEDVVNQALRGFRRGAPPALLLANPDAVYPRRGGGVGITAGAIAALLVRALDAAAPSWRPAFRPVGKPSPEIFDDAIARLGTRRLVMIGDQLETDVAGAHAAGLAAALIDGGIAGSDATAGGIVPEHRLAAFATLSS